MRGRERGFGLIETLVVIALTAIIALGAGATTVQMTQVTDRNKDHSIASSQAQSLGYWLSQDMMKALTISTADDAGTDPVEFVTIKWKEWQTGNTYNIRYCWSDPEDILKTVIRYHTVYDTGGGEISSSTTSVAANIYAVTVSEQAGIGWTLDIESRSGDKSEVREYEIADRKQ